MATSKLELAVGTGQWDAGLKKAQQALNSFTQSQGGLQQALGKDNEKMVQFVQMMGKIDSTANTAKGKLRDYRNSIEQLSAAFNSLSDAQKKGVEGQAITSALDSLKAKAMEAKQEVERLNVELSGSKFGKSGGIIDDIGHKMGVSANLTELLTSKTALMTAGIGAAVAAIYKGTEAWTKYNAELSKQDQITQVTTGLKGSGADHMTDVMRAISDTYKVDFRQAIEAANTLMSQFGVSGSEAIQLIKDGMQGMIQGDGPKLLSMIQQYAPAFRDAGVSASQLVAVIHNSEGGIFTDQNMSAIVMGMKNIRLMTKQTSEALAKLGIDGNQMSQQLSNGSLTVFDALKQVASELKNVDSNSKTAGEVMQTVFGRQGAMAGTNLAKAIETLNTNIKETKEQTGELGDAFAELHTANEKLNTAIRDAFSYDGWEQMAIGIKTTLITALADVLDKLGKIRGFITPGGTTTRRYQHRRIEGEVKDVESATQGEGDSAKIKQQQILDKYDREIKQKQAELERARKNVENAANASLPNAASVRTAESIRDNIENEIESLRKMKEEFRQESNKVIAPPITSTEPNKPTPEPAPNKPDHQNTQSAAKTETQQNEAVIAKLTEEYQNLATAAKAADDAQKAGMTERMTVIQGEIKTLQERNAELKKFADEAKGVKVSVGAEGSLPQLTQQLKDLQQAQGQSLDTREWIEYQKQIDATSTKIDILKGKWKEGQVATFKVDAEAYDKLKELQDLTIDGGTITVKADTAEAYNKVQELISGIEGTTVSFDVKPQAKALPTLDDYRIQAMTAIDTQNTKVDTNTLQTLLKDAMENGIDTTSLNLEPIAEQIGKGINVPDEKWQAIIDKYNKIREAIGENPIQIDLSTGNVPGGSQNGKGKGGKGIEGMDVSNINKITSSVSSIAGGLQKLGVEIPEGFEKTIGVLQIITTMISALQTITSIGAFKLFASGGIVRANDGVFVPGNSYSGDRVPALLNSGEMVLNSFQQQALAGTLQNRYNEHGNESTPYVSGEQIYLGLNNYLKRSGRGEMLTARG